jgi:Family of unknown function (DUF6941)
VVAARWSLCGIGGCTVRLLRSTVQPMPTVFKDGPYLNSALLNERTIQEIDGVLTLVRVVDKVTTRAFGTTEPQPAEMPAFMASLYLTVILRAGRARGDYLLTVRPEDPTGAQLPGSENQLTFTGTDDGAGASVIINMNLGIQHEGLYWFNILLNDQLLTRVPLRIEYQPVQDAQLQAPAAPANSE